MKNLGFLKNRFIIFIFQMFLLSTFIFIFTYKFEINFDSEISKERQEIIQFLANYIIFNIETKGLYSLYFIYFSWLIVALIPVLIFNDYKEAYSMNLTTFFFPNFFFFIFLSRYSPVYYKAYGLTLFAQTIILGIILTIYSIGLSLLMKRILKPKEESQLEDFKLIVSKNISKCPYCGTEFDSIPTYCYNCSKEIIKLESSEE